MRGREARRGSGSALAPHLPESEMPHRSAAVMLVLLLSCASPAARGEDWPQFRGPTGQGVSAASGVPVRWGPDKNVAWKVPVAGRGWSSPVLFGGKVYLTSGV